MPEKSAILFGGVPSTTSPEVFEKLRKRNPLWFQILEQASIQLTSKPEMAEIYGDPKKGATIEQVWMNFTLARIKMHCLLARYVPEDQIKKIQYITHRSPEEHVQLLKKLKTACGELNTSTLHYDGKTGHCIRITDYDEERDRFIYHDPWPERSLLCKENNKANVDAQQDGTRWSVTSKELEQVVYASFLFPHHWAKLQGVDFDIMYDIWKESEFFKLFNLKQTDERSESGMNRRMFAPETFKDYISLIVDSKENGKITKALLILNKDWMIENLRLTIDISKSFVESFAPAPDKEAYSEISRALWNLNDPNLALTIKEKDPDESISIQCVHAFMGLIETARMSTDFGALSFKNIICENENIQEIEFTLL